MADAGIGEAAAAEGAKGAGEAAAAGEAAGLTEAGLGGSALAGALDVAPVAAGLGGAVTAGAPAYASALGAGAGDASLYALPSAGEFAGMSLPALDAASAGLSATSGAASGAAPAYAGPGSPGAGAAGEGAAPSAAGASGTGLTSPTGIGAGEAGNLPAPADVTANPATAQTGTATGTAPAGTVPQQSTVDKALAAIKNNPLQAANVGLGAASLVKQLTTPGVQGQFNNIAAGTKAASDALLQQFKSGTLNGADAFAIQQWAQQSKAAVDQYYAKAGLSNSSMHTDAVNQINAQAEAMRQQAIQNLLTQGLKAAGVSDPTLVAGINAGLKQDDQSMQAMQNFLNQLSKMNTPVPAPAPTGTPG